MVRKEEEREPGESIECIVDWNGNGEIAGAVIIVESDCCRLA